MRGSDGRAAADSGLADHLDEELAADDRARAPMSPTFTAPRACSTARLAELPVPQGERSTRPAFNVVQVRMAPSGSTAAEHDIGDLVQARELRMLHLDLRRQ